MSAQINPFYIQAIFLSTLFSLLIAHFPPAPPRFYRSFTVVYELLDCLALGCGRRVGVTEGKKKNPRT